jgi:hypothetical protein
MTRLECRACVRRENPLLARLVVFGSAYRQISSDWRLIVQRSGCLAIVGAPHSLFVRVAIGLDACGEG